MNVSDESLRGAQAGLASLRARARAIGREAGSSLPGGLVAPDAPGPDGVVPPGVGTASPAELSAPARALFERWTAAVDDDLDLPKGLAIVREAVKASDLPAAERRWLLLEADRVLGLDCGRRARGRFRGEEAPFDGGCGAAPGRGRRAARRAGRGSRWEGLAAQRCPPRRARGDRRRGGGPPGRRPGVARPGRGHLTSVRGRPRSARPLARRPGSRRPARTWPPRPRARTSARRCPASRSRSGRPGRRRAAG